MKFPGLVERALGTLGRPTGLPSSSPPTPPGDRFSAPNPLPTRRLLPNAQQAGSPTLRCLRGWLCTGNLPTLAQRLWVGQWTSPVCPEVFSGPPWGLYLSLKHTPAMRDPVFLLPTFLNLVSVCHLWPIESTLHRLARKYELYNLSKFAHKLNALIFGFKRDTVQCEEK